MNSSESAEAIVRMTLQGSEVALKIAGSGTKELMIMLYTILNGQQKVKGKTTLTNMLKSGKELKVFSVKQEEIMLSFSVSSFKCFATSSYCFCKSSFSAELRSVLCIVKHLS